MKTLKPILLATCLALVQGCATLSKSECREADWRTIGLEDGSAGRPVSYISRHRKACAEHGVKPDLSQYQRGHGEGLKLFCTPHNGFRLGKSGRGHNDVCPPELSAEFLAAYEDGRDLYLLQKDVSQARDRVDTAETEIEDLRQRIERLEAALVAGSGTASERENWLQQLKKLQYEEKQQAYEIEDLRRRADEIQGEYNYLNSLYSY